MKICPTSSDCAVITETAVVTCKIKHFTTFLQGVIIPCYAEPCTTLFLPGCSSSARHNFFTYASKMWNDLPADSTDFSSLNILARYSKVYFFLDVLDGVITDYGC